MANIYFYKIAMYYENQEIEFNIDNFFNNISSYGRANKLRKIETECPIMLEYKRSLSSGKSGFLFYKFRQDKPYYETPTKDLEQLGTELIELTNCCLDANYNLIAIQYNQFGIRASGIIKYLNSFIENKKFEIRFDKIYKSDDLNRILTNDRIREIKPIFSKITNPSGGIISNQFLTAVATCANDNTNSKLSLEVSIKNTERNGSLSGNSTKTLLDLLLNVDTADMVDKILITYVDQNKVEHKDCNVRDLQEQLKINLNKSDSDHWEKIFVEVDRNYNEKQNIALANFPSNIISKNVITDNFVIRTQPTEEERVIQD